MKTFFQDKIKILALLFLTIITTAVVYHLWPKPSSIIVLSSYIIILLALIRDHYENRNN